MTTIAWDGRTLAADRARTNGNTSELACKLFDCGEYVYGAVGSMFDAPLIEKWLRDGAKWEQRPHLDGEVHGCGIVVRKSDRALYLVGGKPTTLAFIPPGPTAAGSGQDFALAAMACGKTAREAVEIAARFDFGTGYGCDAFDVDELLL
jgi:hypothetical protein